METLRLLRGGSRIASIRVGGLAGDCSAWSVGSICEHIPLTKKDMDALAFGILQVVQRGTNHAYPDRATTKLVTTYNRNNDAWCKNKMFNSALRKLSYHESRPRVLGWTGSDKYTMRVFSIWKEPTVHCFKYVNKDYSWQLNNGGVCDAKFPSTADLWW